MPEVKERLARDGLQPVASKPDAYAAFIKREIEQVKTLVRTAGIKSD
jgi:tripartite-type tricarboxylate transporter receptor subunit TctC